MDELIHCCCLAVDKFKVSVGRMTTPKTMVSSGAKEISNLDLRNRCPKIPCQKLLQRSLLKVKIEHAVRLGLVAESYNVAPTVPRRQCSCVHFTLCLHLTFDAKRANIGD